jgi:hypothetical protein
MPIRKRGRRRSTRKIAKRTTKTRLAMTSAQKVRAHRERLREQGLRPVQFWLPDVHSDAFKTEAHRQSLLIAQSAHANEDQAFVDAISIPLHELDS